MRKAEVNLPPLLVGGLFKIVDHIVQYCLAQNFDDDDDDGLNDLQPSLMNIICKKPALPLDRINFF